MKTRFLVAAACLLSAGPAFPQSLIEPNSTFFQVRDYYYPTSGGDYGHYQAAGFVQPAAPGISPIIFMLPTISVGKDDIRYFREDGTSFDPDVHVDTPVGSITIHPKYVATMPNALQIPAIASTLDGNSIHRYVIPPVKNGTQPAMTNEAAFAPHVRAAIQEDYAAYEAQVSAQQQLAEKYRNYQKKIATLGNLEVRLLIGGEVAASRTYAGTSTNLGPITLLAPTEFQKNQVREGNFELEVVSRFRDTKTSSIAANFDAETAVKSFLEETQKAVTKSKSSGFQVFGIGSRRSKMSTSINQTMRVRDDVAVMDRTNVVMYDATDDMIEEFESRFFPSISREDVIDRHLEAAAQARAENNLGLARVHEDYANAIRAGDEMKEVDSVAAAAALNAGDYAGFVAHGVRAIDSNNKKSNNFRRVVEAETVRTMATEWNQTRTITVMREVSVPVTLERDLSYYPRMGICGYRQGVDYGWVQLNQWGMPYQQMEQGLMVSCVEANSPAAQAGVVPGMMIRAVGSRYVSTFADVAEVMRDVEPGDIAHLWVAQSPSPSSPVSTERHIRVATRRGPAI